MTAEFRVPVQTRFGDTDLLGHINHATLVQYLELARLSYARSLHLKSIDMVVAHLELDFRNEVKLEQNVIVAMWVNHIGQSSFTLGYRVEADGRCCVEAQSVQVCIDLNTMRPHPIPATLRVHLELLCPMT